MIYYAGPTPGQQGMAVGACGPTTASRMDAFAPRLLDLGLGAMIGKGERSQEVADVIVRNRACYFAAVGGAGGTDRPLIPAAEVIAFDELGCESVKKNDGGGLPPDGRHGQHRRKSLPQRPGRIRRQIRSFEHKERTGIVPVRSFL